MINQFTNMPQNISVVGLSNSNYKAKPRPNTILGYTGTTTGTKSKDSEIIRCKMSDQLKSMASGVAKN
jgi:hypothetical protein